MPRRAKGVWPVVTATHDEAAGALVVDISGITRVLALEGREPISVLVGEISHLATTLARSTITVTLKTKTEERPLVISQSGEVIVGAALHPRRWRGAEPARKDSAASGPADGPATSWEAAIGGVGTGAGGTGAGAAGTAGTGAGGTGAAGTGGAGTGGAGRTGTGGTGAGSTEPGEPGGEPGGEYVTWEQVMTTKEGTP